MKSIHFGLSVGLLLLAGCAASSADDDAGNNGSDDSEAVHVEEATPAEASVEAYERFWDIVIEASEIPDPDYPPLQDVATGDGLETMTLMLTELDAQGHYTSGAPGLEPTVVGLVPEEEPEEAVIHDCIDTNSYQLMSAANDEPVEGEEYGARMAQVTLDSHEGDWVVSSVAIWEIGSC